MNEKSRATRWRDTLVAKGGKPVGVTLSAGAAAALEAIQARYAVSQREAISRALEFAAGHMGREGDGAGFAPGAGDPSELRLILARIEGLERRLDGIEARSGGPDRESAGEFVLDRPDESGEAGAEAAISGEAADRLVDFSARYMWEFGERVARNKLYELARQEGVPIHDTLHAYSAFVSLHMDGIRERMRNFK